MTVQSMPTPRLVGNERRRTDTSPSASGEELRSDAQLLGVTGIAAAAMIGVAHAEVAATLTAGLTALATVPLWLRARRLEHAAVRAESRHRSTDT